MNNILDSFWIQTVLQSSLFKFLLRYRCSHHQCVMRKSTLWLYIASSSSCWCTFIGNTCVVHLDAELHHRIHFICVPGEVGLASLSLVFVLNLIQKRISALEVAQVSTGMMAFLSTKTMQSTKENVLRCLSLSLLLLLYSVRGAKYSDEYVHLSVCLHSSKTTQRSFGYLHGANCCGWVLLSFMALLYIMYIIFGFVNNVIMSRFHIMALLHIMCILKWQ